mmetsp:Transcript_1720/g.3386  ORF Transcript_1720/g.3386 Transcript_1720/m.3386 type:complete len:89 (+) Transcript_1720:153-419(+)
MATEMKREDQWREIELGMDVLSMHSCKKSDSTTRKIFIDSSDSGIRNALAQKQYTNHLQPFNQTRPRSTSRKYRLNATLELPYYCESP